MQDAPHVRCALVMKAACHIGASTAHLSAAGSLKENPRNVEGNGGTSDNDSKITMGVKGGPLILVMLDSHAFLEP